MISHYRTFIYLFKIFFYLLIDWFLTAPGLHCSVQASLVVVHGLIHPVACGIFAPQSGIEPLPPALDGRVLTTGPPAKSPMLSHLFDAPPQSPNPSLPWTLSCMYSLKLSLLASNLAISFSPWSFVIPCVGIGPKSNGNPIFLPDLSFHVFNFLLVLLPWVPVADFFSWEGFDIEDVF